jgi:hypothetical protein
MHLRTHALILALTASVAASCATPTPAEKTSRGGSMLGWSSDEVVEGARAPDFTISARADRFAFLFGVSKYDSARDGFGPLNAHQDEAVMRRALGRQGFDDANVVSLQDAQATREGVLEAMASLTRQIEAAEQPVRLVVVHYSGHGQQIADQNGDELDGYDEALALWGAKADDVEGKGHLRDDDFGAALTALRRAMGPEGHLLVLLDMCHSGQASKSSATTRGSVAPAGPPAPVSEGATRTQDAPFAAEAEGTGGGLAGMVMISAARADEQAYEVHVDYGGQKRALGAMTYAFVDTLDRMGNTAGVTYQDVFSSVRHVVSIHSRSQTPQLEGDLGAGLFGGNNLGLPASLSVATVEAGGRFTMASGRLIGLDVGAVVSLHAPGVDPASAAPMATAHVIEASETAATLALAGPEDRWPSRQDVATARVYLDRPSYGDARVSVGVDPAATALRGWLTANAPYVRVQDEASHMLVASPTSIALEQVASEPGDVRYEGSPEPGVLFSVARAKGAGFADDAAAQAALGEQLKAFAQIEYLRNLTAYDSRLTGELEFIGSKASGADVGACKAEHMTGPLPAGETVAQGTEYQLRVTNTGDAPAYVYVVALSSDGVAYLLHPLTRGSQEDAKLPPDTPKTLPVCLTTNEPGTDRFRVFSSKKPLLLPRLFESGRIQMQDLGGSKGASRGTDDPFAEAARLFDLEPDGSRGVSVRIVQPASLTVQDATITVE